MPHAPSTHPAADLGQADGTEGAGHAEDRGGRERFPRRCDAGSRRPRGGHTRGDSTAEDGPTHIKTKSCSRRWKGFGTTELLFGRRTYEQFYGYWPKQTDGNPFTGLLNATRKYVASRTLTEPLPWENSTLLPGDAAEALEELKRQPGKDLVVLGSGELVRDLMRHGLVDAFALLIHPLVLGAGRRLFPDSGSSTAWRLTSSVPTSTGVVIANYELEGSSERAEP